MWAAVKGKRVGLESSLEPASTDDRPGCRRRWLPIVGLRLSALCLTRLANNTILAHVPLSESVAFDGSPVCSQRALSITESMAVRRWLCLEGKASLRTLAQALPSHWSLTRRLFHARQATITLMPLSQHAAPCTAQALAFGGM